MLQDASRQVARLARIFDRQPVAPEKFQEYAADLADVPPVLLEEAVTEIIRTHEWFPPLSAIRAQCAELALALPSEAVALSQVDARIRWARERSLGGSEGAPAVHALVARALDQVGGYAAFKAADKPEMARGQFCRVYRELRAEAVRDVQLAPALAPGSHGRELTA